MRRCSHYKLGVRKPDPRIYQHALAAIGVRPEDAIFVGDGGSDEHRGARAVGMRTVLVTRFLSRWRPERIAERRPHADWEFADVVGFVNALPSKSVKSGTHPEFEEGAVVKIRGTSPDFRRVISPQAERSCFRFCHSMSISRTQWCRREYHGLL